MARQRIALYGGTFDPVHVGHLAIARGLLKSFALDQVLFIPAHVAPHKKRRAPASSAWQRFAMLALATQDEPRLCVSSIEIETPERPYTIETLSRLLAEFGATARLFFVMGADSWAEIDTWREWERVLISVNHIVVTRPGYTLGSGHVTGAVRDRIVDLRGASEEMIARAAAAREKGIFFTDVVQMNVSATEIRRALDNDTGDRFNAATLLSPPVANFIEKYQLYREAHESEGINNGRHPTRNVEAGG